MSAILLLDRDGTLNVKAPEGEYVTSPQQIEVLPGAAEGIRLANVAGVPVAVVTNQRGIALGRMTTADLSAVNARLAELLAADDAVVDLWLHCPHDKGTCDCRKPLPGLLEQALASLGGTPGLSLMVGDAASDVEAGQAAGVPSVRFRAAPDHPGLAEIVATWLDDARR